MILKKIAIAAVLSTSLAGAMATTTHLGPVSIGVPLTFAGFAAPGGYIDYFTFSMPSNGGSGYSVSNFVALPALYTTLLTSLTLVKNPDGILFNGDDSVVTTSIVPGGGTISMMSGPTSAGTYYLTVMGLATGPAGGIYNGAISVSAIPEPETYALMLAGVCAIGFVVARRKARG